MVQAQEIGQRIQAEARDSAREEAEQIVVRARQEIQQERDLAIARVREEFADLTIRAAERVIGQAVDRDAHDRLIQEVLAESTLDLGRRN